MTPGNPGVFKAQAMRDVHLEYSRVFKDLLVKYFSLIRKNRPEFNRIFQVYSVLGVHLNTFEYFGVYGVR